MLYFFGLQCMYVDCGAIRLLMTLVVSLNEVPSSTPVVNGPGKIFV